MTKLEKLERMAGMIDGLANAAYEMHLVGLYDDLDRARRRADWEIRREKMALEASGEAFGTGRKKETPDFLAWLHGEE